MRRRLCSAALIALAYTACRLPESQAPVNTAAGQTLAENDNLRRRIAQMEEENRCGSSTSPR